MRHHAAVEKVKADILSVFKNMLDTEVQQKQQRQAERLRRARQRIEERREKRRLHEELSNGWDLELN